MAGEDPAYMAHLRTQQCQAPVPCVMLSGPPHHSTNGSTLGEGERPTGKQLGGRRGKSQTAHDHHAFALCVRHHRQFHDESGPFAGWTKEQRRDWQDDEVRKARNRYAEECPEAATPQPGGATRPRANPAQRERLRIASWLRDRAGARHLKPNESALLVDAASELEAMT